MPTYTYKCSAGPEFTDKVKYEDFNAPVTPGINRRTGWCLTQVGDNVCGLTGYIVFEPTPFVMRTKSVQMRL